MSYDLSLREEVKKRVARDFFSKFDTIHILGNVDFCVFSPDGLGLMPDIAINWEQAKKKHFLRRFFSCGSDQ